MNEEIKEILEALKPHNDIKEYPLYLNRKQQDLLYDCITNLQQDLDKANDIIEKDRQFYKCRMDEYAELKKENEKLKELNICVGCENNPDYKSRCKRANKIITDFMCTEEYCSVEPVAIAENYMEIQKALNGSDKNE